MFLPPLMQSFSTSLPEDSLSPSSQHAAHILQHDACTRIVYSRFNVRVFIPSLSLSAFHPSPHGEEGKIENCIIFNSVCGSYNVIFICILFHLESSSSLPLVWHFKSHRLPLFLDNNDERKNEIIFDRGLMAIVRNK